MTTGKSFTAWRVSGVVWAWCGCVSVRYGSLLGGPVETHTYLCVVWGDENRVVVSFSNACDAAEAIQLAANGESGDRVAASVVAIRASDECTHEDLSSGVVQVVHHVHL